VTFAEDEHEVLLVVQTRRNADAMQEHFEGWRLELERKTRRPLRYREVNRWRSGPMTLFD